MGDRGRLMEVLAHLRPSGGWGYLAASQVSDPAVLAPRPELATTEPLETTGGGHPGSRPQEDTLCSLPSGTLALHSLDSG